MKTIDSLIDFFDRLATPRMTDTQIEIIERKLLNLAEVDGEAARHYADLYRSHLNWEGSRSAEQRQNLVDQARNAQAWLDRRMIDERSAMSSTVPARPSG